MPYSETFDYTSTGMWNANAMSAGLWSNYSNGVVDNGRFTLSSGKHTQINLENLGLKTDGTMYEIDYTIGANSWLSSTSWNRAGVVFDDKISLFDILTYNTATKAECAVLGIYKGGNNATRYDVKMLYRPSDGKIIVNPGWSSGETSSTYSAGSVAGCLKFNSNGVDTIYIDNVSVSEAVAPQVPVFEVSSPNVSADTFAKFKSLQDKKVTVNWSNTKQDADIVVFITYYTANGEMVGSEKLYSGTMKRDDEVGVIEETITNAIPENAVSAKVMVWDNMVDRQPYISDFELK